MIKNIVSDDYKWVYQREKSYIFQLLNNILCDSNDKDFQYNINELNWEYIYKLCSYHKIDNIIAYKVCSDPISTTIPQNIVNKFKLSMQKAKAREAVQEIEYEQILQSFEEQGIKNIPLKGSVLDLNTEKNLLSNLRKVKGKTVICISHREAAMEACDNVVSLENGTTHIFHKL